MKKLSVSKALIGLFVVLAVGIGLAACYDGVYEGDSSGGSGHYKVTLEPGSKYTAEETWSGTTYKTTGTYEVKSILGIQYIDFTAETKDHAFYYFSGSYLFDGTTISVGAGLKKKTIEADGALIELYFSSDLSDLERTELGL
ncbi:hypothetical protein FACS1894110_19470 [Spirochaetia bacterium]|nr:hypothetical protein FACS1894110_19470 [Spirochaetia bacterium]